MYYNINGKCTFERKAPSRITYFNLLLEITVHSCLEKNKIDLGLLNASQMLSHKNSDIGAEDIYMVYLWMQFDFSFSIFV